MSRDPKCACGEPYTGNINVSGEPGWYDMQTTKEPAWCGECERLWWILTNIYTKQVRLIERESKVTNGR